MSTNDKSLKEILVEIDDRQKQLTAMSSYINCNHQMINEYAQLTEKVIHDGKFLCTMLKIMEGRENILREGFLALVDPEQYFKDKMSLTGVALTKFIKEVDMPLLKEDIINETLKTYVEFNKEVMKRATNS